MFLKQSLTSFLRLCLLSLWFITIFNLWGLSSTDWIYIYIWTTKIILRTRHVQIQYRAMVAGGWFFFFQTRQRRSDQMKKISERDGKQPMTGTPKNDDRFCGCHCANPGAPCWFMTNVYFCSKNWGSWAWIGCRFHSKINNWLVVWNMFHFSI
jgi:hypothetical protein